MLNLKQTAKAVALLLAVFFAAPLMAGVFGDTPPEQVFDENIQKFEDAEQGLADKLKRLADELDESELSLEEAIDKAQEGKTAFDEIFELTKPNGRLEQSMTRALESQKAALDAMLSDDMLSESQKSELSDAFNENIVGIQQGFADIRASVKILHSYADQFESAARYLGHQVQTQVGKQIIADLENIAQILRQAITDLEGRVAV